GRRPRLALRAPALAARAQHAARHDRRGRFEVAPYAHLLLALFGSRRSFSRAEPRLRVAAAELRHRAPPAARLRRAQLGALAWPCGRRLFGGEQAPEGTAGGVSSPARRPSWPSG